MSGLSAVSAPCGADTAALSERYTYAVKCGTHSMGIANAKSVVERIMSATAARSRGGWESNTAGNTRGYQFNDHDIFVVTVGNTTIVIAYYQNPPTSAASSSSSPNANAASPYTGPTASVTFTSDPAGAKVTIDNVAKGQTPLTVEVPVNRDVRYQIEAEEPSEGYRLYKPFEGVLRVSEDTPISVWLDRTSAEEQAAQRASFEREQRAEALRRVNSSGPWRYVEQRDPITDEDTSYLYNVPIRHTDYSFRDPAFYVNCDSEWSLGVKPYIFTDDYIGDQNGSVRVDYRFDERVGVEGARWLGSNTGRAAFVPNQSRASFFREMAAADELTLRVYDYRDAYNTFEFRVAGFADALSLLSCYTGSR